MAQPHTDTQAAVVRTVEEAGFSVSDEEARSLAAHLDRLYGANRALNLTRVPVEKAPTLHVVDSLHGLGAMRRGGEGPWADLGSGNGFPGVPLCVCGQRHVDLIESVGKKAAFLEGLAADLCLDATIRAVRAEAAARVDPECYAAVSARAVGPLWELVELASPLLRRGGVLVAWKTLPLDEEIERGERAAAHAGMTLAGVARYDLADAESQRALAIFEKTGAARVRLPRREGLARRRPLG